MKRFLKLRPSPRRHKENGSPEATAGPSEEGHNNLNSKKGDTPALANAAETQPASIANSSSSKPANEPSPSSTQHHHHSHNPFRMFRAAVRRTPRNSLEHAKSSDSKQSSASPSPNSRRRSRGKEGLPPSGPSAHIVRHYTVIGSRRVSVKEVVPKIPAPLVPEEADPLVQQALSAQEGTELDEESRLKLQLAVQALDRSGNQAFQNADYDAAFARYERALWLKRRTLEASPPKRLLLQDNTNSVLASVATSINNMTYLKQRSGQATTDETMASYVKSLQIKREILGPDHLSVGKTLNNIGSVFYLKHEYDAALAAYRDAYRILRLHLGDDHLDVGTVVSNIADVHAAGGETGSALENYRSALNLRWKALGAKDPKVIRLMEQIARLETGEQPVSDGSFHDDGTPDESHHDAIFLEEVQTLQSELKEDMKYFDLVERQMAIDMVKDKTQFFREMRKFMDSEEAVEVAAAAAAAAEDMDGSVPHMSLPSLEERLDRLCQGLSEDNDDEVPNGFVLIDESPEVEAEAVPGEKPTLPVIPDNPPEPPVANADMKVEETEPQVDTVIDPEQDTNSVDESSTSQTQDELSEIPKSPTETVESLQFQMEEMERSRSPGSEASLSPTHTSKSFDFARPMRVSTEPIKISKQRLTAAERQEALSNVRGRLEEIRARNRMAVTVPTEHRSYMDPTVSSAAKMHVPHASLLGSSASRLQPTSPKEPIEKGATR